MALNELYVREQYRLGVHNAFVDNRQTSDLFEVSVTQPDYNVSSQYNVSKHRGEERTQLFSDLGVDAQMVRSGIPRPKALQDVSSLLFFFLQDCQQYMQSVGLSAREMFDFVIPELLAGDVLQWFLYKRRDFQIWDDFVGEASVVFNKHGT